MLVRLLKRIVVAGILVQCSTLTNLAVSSQVNVTFAWNPSADNRVAGYRIYQGLASHSYTSVSDVGNATTATLSDLYVGTNYFFAVTAYTSLGLESAPSSEVSYTPVLPPVPILQLSASSQGVLLSGSAPAGYIYQVLASSDLVNWSALGTVTIDATGSFQFTEVPLGSVPARFYRLQQISPPLIVLPLSVSMH